MHVIGTAGHVDHGKSSLVLALSGIDPDRLAEEKAREMTIDLGFAWMTMPGGETVGIVDVPGHRDFIDNMLAGTGGIDVVMMVIAADEGIMPQTREHLAIVDLLEIPRGVIALTKIDMVSEPGWMDIVRADIAAFVKGSVLEGASVIPVSARTGEGLGELIEALEGVIAVSRARVDRGAPRLPIDRVFTMKGFGTVVTGTLDGGVFSVGDEVEIVPRGTYARVRGLQSHRQAVETAQPGTRVAINLSGVSAEQIGRGDVVARPGRVSGTQLVDVRFRHHRDSGRVIRHNDTVRFFCGAAETSAQVRLVGSQEIAPGDEGFVQLRLETPLGVGKGDRFILRWPSPPATIGGGKVLDPLPGHRWRRFKPEVIARFEALARGTADDVLIDALEMRAAAVWADIVKTSGLAADVAENVLERLAGSGDAIGLGEGWWMSGARWERLSGELRREVSAYHGEHPLKIGMPREALRSRIGIEIQGFNRILGRACEIGLLAEDGTSVRLPEHQITFSEAQERAIEGLDALIAENPAAPPSVKEIEAMVGRDVLEALIEMGRLAQVGADVCFDAGTYQRLVEEIREYARANGSITIAQARDLFRTSRKYATALLEHLDEIGITERDGDAHVLKATRQTSSGAGST